MFLPRFGVYATFFKGLFQAIFFWVCESQTFTIGELPIKYSLWKPFVGQFYLMAAPSELFLGNQDLEATDICHFKYFGVADVLLPFYAQNFTDTVGENAQVVSGNNSVVRRPINTGPAQ